MQTLTIVIKHLKTKQLFKTYFCTLPPTHARAFNKHFFASNVMTFERSLQ